MQRIAFQKSLCYTIITNLILYQHLLRILGATMKNFLISLSVCAFAIFLINCDEESTDPEFEQLASERQYMEIIIGSDTLMFLSNMSEVWLSESVFGPAMYSDQDKSWPDSLPTIAFGIYLGGFPFNTGIEPNTIINLTNNTTDITVEMYVSLTEPGTGIVGEDQRTTTYHQQLSGQILIHQYEPDNDDAQTGYDYHYSVEVKNLTMQKLTGDLYPAQILIRYASFCKTNKTCVNTR